MTLTAITEAVYTAIKNNVTALDNRVFPLVATEGTSLPFAVFERTDFQGLQIADSIIEAMEHTAYRPTLTASNEEYTNDGFLQILTFSF